MREQYVVLLRIKINDFLWLLRMQHTAVKVKLCSHRWEVQLMNKRDHQDWGVISSETIHRPDTLWKSVSILFVSKRPKKTGVSKRSVITGRGHKVIQARRLAVSIALLDSGSSCFKVIIRTSWTINWKSAATPRPIVNTLLGLLVLLELLFLK